MKYRVRIVFNAPVDREHPFTSVSKDTLEEANQIIEDMAPAIVHAVSVTIQQMDDEAAQLARWQTVSWQTMSTIEPGKLRE